MATAVTHHKHDALALIEATRERIAAFLPEGVNVDRVIAAVSLALNDPERGRALAACDPASVVRAVGRIAQWGLEVGTTAHLVPFGQTCTPVADYKGLAELMVASGAVRHVEARAVYEHDDFVCVQGLNPDLRHQPAPASRRGKIVGAYCILRLPFGRSAFEFMPIEDIDAIRLKHSKQWKSGECPAWYAAKTVVRRAAKLIPTNPRLASALARIDGDEAVALEALPGRASLALAAGEVAEPRHAALAATPDDGYGHAETSRED